MATSETWIDKSTWGEGPWQHEPDRIEWRVGGLVALMRRNSRHGMWCGYVGVPAGHPWHGKKYHEIDADVHGGLNYADECMVARPGEDPRELICHVPQAGESDDAWWLGFDCHHMNDLAPGFAAHERELAANFRAAGDIRGAELFERGPEFFGLTYRDVDYVRNEVEGLVQQAAAAR